MNIPATTTTHDKTQRRTRLPWAARMVIGLLERIETGRLDLTLPNGDRIRCGQSGLGTDLTIRDWGVFTDVARRGDVGFGEAYMAERWQTSNLVALLTLFAANREPIDRAIYGGIVGRVLLHLNHLLNANTRRGSRRNIAQHYDLGNAFYALWLDPSMTYSSALFADHPERSLETAQRAKYERILAQLRLDWDANILEIGCGWGGFAELAIERGHRLTGLSLSREQLDFARARLAHRGFGDRANLAWRDYRDVHERYDHVVSIEMIEAVGEAYWPTYFERVAQSLHPGGTAVIQAITINEALFERYRRGTDFIQQYIFPGGMLATPSRLRAECERAGLQVLDTYGFGPDYARTLSHWRSAFLAHAPALRELGFDDAFQRMWEFYLAYSEAGFATQCTDVYQLTLVRP